MVMKSIKTWFTQASGIITSVTATVTALVGLYALLVENDIIPNIFASRHTETQEEQTETAEPATDDSAPWKENARVLAQWKDQYWYRGTVREVDRAQHRYSVEFGDGSSAWIFTAQILPDDIKVGDHILADWGKGGTYYWGKIAARNGDDIHITYDEGGEEDTTIDVVKVVRPRTD